jgi:hypothetical protein
MTDRLQDVERLQTLAAWHGGQARECRRLERRGRSSWMIERHRMLGAHHEAAAGFLSQLSYDITAMPRTSRLSFVMADSRTGLEALHDDSPSHAR